MSNIITYDKIRVDCPYPIQSITELEIKSCFNEHGRITMKGILWADQKDQCINYASAEDQIAIYDCSESGHDEKLFCGVVTSLEVKHAQGIYYVEIEAASYTYLLDHKLESRSFQDKGALYSTVIGQVLAKYKNAYYIQVPEDCPTGSFILQYKETDWAFIKRLASHFNTILIPDILGESPRFHLGIHQREKKLENITYFNTKKDMQQYHIARSHGLDVYERDFVKYEIESETRLLLGDCVLFQGEKHIVEAVRASFIDGLFVYQYLLGYQKGSWLPIQRNKQIHSVSLLGKVLDATNQTVKIKLNIDENQDVNKACWFPYAAQANNLFYCMPEKGTSISLYFPSADESSCMAVNAVRRNGGNCSKTSNPDVKYMGIPSGQEFKLGETDIDFLAHDGLYLKMDTGNGVVVQSHENLSVFSKQKLLLEAQEMIQIFSETGNIVAGSGEGGELSQLYLIGGADGDAHLFAESQLLHDGRLKEPFTERLNEEIAYEEKKFDWWKLAGNVLAGLAVVALVTVAIVATGGAAAIAVGAAISGTLAVGTMAAGDIMRGEVSSTKDYMLAGLKGAVEGAICGAVSTIMAPLSAMQKIKALGPVAQLFAKAGISGLTAFVTDGISQGFNILFNGGSYDWKRGLTSFAIGFAMPFAAKGFQTLVNKYGGKMPTPLRKALCILAGEPVDVVTGTMISDAVDFELPGPLPLIWHRSWYSGSGFIGHLGHGTRCSFEMGIDVFEEEQVLGVFLADGRVAAFPYLLVGEEFFHYQEKMLLKREIDHYCLFDPETRYSYLFYPQNGYLQYQLTAVQNRQGHQILLEYNGNGHLVKITDSASRVLSVVTNEVGRITEVALLSSGSHRHVLVQYRYNMEQDLIEIVDAVGKSTRLKYHNHLMQQKIDRNQHSFYWQYEQSETGYRVKKTWGDGGVLALKLRYQDEAGYNEVTDSLGNTSVYHYDEKKLCSRIVYADFTQLNRKYNDRYELVNEIDEEGRLTSYYYNDWSQLTAVIRPDGSQISYQYDEAGRLVLATNPEGDSCQWLYHEDDTLQKSIAEDGSETSYTYNDNKLMEMVTNTKGETVSLAYDADWNLKQVTLPNGSSSSWQYDSRGNCLTWANSLGAIQKYQYDALARLVQVDLPDGNNVRLAYNGYDDVIEVNDRHTKVNFSYTILGSLASRRQNGKTVEYQYDTEERLISVTNEKKETYQFERDAKGNIVKEVSFDKITRSYERDLTGLVKKINRPDGRWTTYQHDKLGNVIRLDYFDGTWDSFGYNKNGVLIEAANEDAILKFERNQTGQILKEWQNEHWVASEYDEVGNRLQVASSLGARTAMVRNELGRVTHLATAHAGHSAWTAKMQYDELGQELERIVPGNVVSKWQYDTAGKPVHHLVRNGRQTTRNRTYHWGINDQLKRVTNQLTGTYTSFGYDECCNLVQSQDEWLNSLYRNVDDVGNLFETKDRSDRIYGAGSRLLQANVDTKELRNEFQGGYGKLVTKGTMYAYDAEGNLIRKIEPDGSLWQYEYFGNGMLSKVIKPDKTEVTFKYDSLGRRIEKCSDSKVIKFVWDGNTPLHEWEEVEQTPPYANESLVTWLFDDGFVPVAKLTNEGNYSIISDYLGTPVEAYDEDGKSVWSAELDIYGRVKTCIGEEGFVPFRYQGQYADSEIGLYYNRFRYYSPDDGGYTQQDPIGLAGGNPTLYGYVRDTNSWIDVFGLASFFRSMSRLEFFDIIDFGWRSTEGGMSGKWFAESFDNAVTFGQQMGHGVDSKFYIVEVDIPDDIVNKAYRVAGKHDNIGSSSYFEVKDLNSDSVKIKSRNSVRVDEKQRKLGGCNG